eukprot:755135-Hanusia_phi.AAC.12
MLPRYAPQTLCRPSCQTLLTYSPARTHLAPSPCWSKTKRSMPQMKHFLRTKTTGEGRRHGEDRSGRGAQQQGSRGRRVAGGHEDKQAADANARRGGSATRVLQETRQEVPGHISINLVLPCAQL